MDGRANGLRERLIELLVRDSEDRLNARKMGMASKRGNHSELEGDEQLDSENEERG